MLIVEGSLEKDTGFKGRRDSGAIKCWREIFYGKC